MLFVRLFGIKLLLPEQAFSGREFQTVSLHLLLLLQETLTSVKASINSVKKSNKNMQHRKRAFETSDRVCKTNEKQLAYS